MNNNNALLSQTVGTNFVKMSKLNELIGVAFRNSKAASVSIYIDTYSIIKQVLGCNTTWSHYGELAELIIDMCAHYRKFFKGIGVDTKFYIVSSYNLPVQNKIMIPEYNCSFAMRLTAGIVKQIENNLKYLEVLCPYLPGIYFINSSFESSVCISNLITGINDGNPNIIISKDPYNLQIVGKLDNTALIRPSKYRGSDNSRIVYDTYTFWNEFCTVMNISTSNEIKVGINCLSSIFALTKLPCRDLPSIISTKHLLNFINTSIDNWLLNPTGFTSSFAVQALKGRDKNIDAVIENGIIDKRYMCIDIEYQSHLYIDTAEFRSIKLKDLYDPEAVKHINNTYFKGLIDLDNL